MAFGKARFDLGNGVGGKGNTHEGGNGMSTGLCWLGVWLVDWVGKSGEGAAGCDCGGGEGCWGGGVGCGGSQAGISMGDVTNNLLGNSRGPFDSWGVFLLRI